MEILIDNQLEKIFESIIINGHKKNIQPASYDLRVGSEIYFPERGERKKIQNDEFGHLQPFESALIKTIEEIHLPNNMVALMQPSTRLSTRGLIYTGGSVDPGYEGFLWVSIRNMAPRYEEIEYGQSIASIQLFEFGEGKRVIKGYAEEHGRIDTLSQDRRPPKPERTLYDWIKISSKLDEVGNEINLIKTQVDSVNKILFELVYAAIAGIIAGLVVGLIIILIQYVFIPFLSTLK